jgi:hypothetical protein
MSEMGRKRTLAVLGKKQRGASSLRSAQCCDFIGFYNYRAAPAGDRDVADSAQSRRRFSDVKPTNEGLRLSI